VLEKGEDWANVEVWSAVIVGTAVAPTLASAEALA
jgi:hypothetical protein